MLLLPGCMSTLAMALPVGETPRSLGHWDGNVNEVVSNPCIYCITIRLPSQPCPPRGCMQRLSVTLMPLANFFTQRLGAITTVSERETLSIVTDLQ